LQRQYDVMTSLAATLQPIKRSEGRLQQPISSQRADTKRIKGELPSKKSSFDAPRARLPDLSQRSRVSEFVLTRRNWWGRGGATASGIASRS